MLFEKIWLDPYTWDFNYISIKVILMTLVAELEREYILQRQQEGIAIAKQQWRYKGRKPIVHPEFDKVVSKWRSGDISAVEAMRRLNMKPSLFIEK